MKLYYFPVAPNPTRVRTYLAEKGISIDYQLVDLLGGEQKTPEHLARNPMGNLPVLELDDRTFLTESSAIIEFFEELHPDPPMLGIGPISRARVRSLERIADNGVLGAIGRIVHATRSPLGLPPAPELAELFRAALPQYLQVLEDNIGDSPFIAGDQPTIPDCTLHAALNFGSFFDVTLEDRFEKLNLWWERFKQRPSTQLD